MNDRKWHEGQEVLIFNVNRRDGREGLPGKVVRVGRTLFQVVQDGQATPETENFRMEDGRANDGYGHAFVLTPEEAGDRDRRSAAVEEIREAGLDFRTGKEATFSTGELEDLALRLKSFGRIWP